MKVACDDPRLLANQPDVALAAAHWAAADGMTTMPNRLSNTPI